MPTDEYKTITSAAGQRNAAGQCSSAEGSLAAAAEGYYTEKRSKFLAFAHHVESDDEVRAVVAAYRKKYYDARHVCYAYVLGADRLTFRSNDDGEPSSTAGKPILGQINSRELTDVLVIVVRYYGGVNLGTGGLIVAYRTAAAEALDAAVTVVRQVEEEVVFSFAYPMMNDVMRVVKDMNPRIIAQDYGNTCTLRLAIRQSEAAILKGRLDKLAFE